ncbi:THO complex subunit 4B-like isoform X1 [Nicotiana tabacum]|uniref:THO complex subunit 4B-like isoform X1 n=2 Tax=Nicotiana TaxID=4085 RepID=A0A1S3Z532_TOBAC|nr:PREDICTED: THO complex subunit 4B-like isoform X1 [Nicotiana sylvestris]XP_016459322.1 PREDICTED: THO complex subunit 4B-like isoform X1 [Nicotiana tabacum]
MAESVDMSLDDIIKKNKQKDNGGRRSRGHIDQKRRSVRVYGSGTCRGGPSRRCRMTPYSMPQRFPEPDKMMVGASEWDYGTKLFVSNLDYGVSNDDIRLLFSDVGELKEYALHYDKTGRSKGTAEVVFTHRSDALAAMKRYNNLQLDGRPMKIEVKFVTHPVPSILPDFAPENPRGTFQSRPGVAADGRARNGRRGGHMIGRGGFIDRSHHKPVSAEDLDADLDKYHSDAMHIK